ncbi:hypothetical protein CKO_01795 [Citrobacter koseri ATCC BAA-895]|uniref:Uncharacterized protein n=1 Tax=Citrobacter koseri (strain ATCC BAA-895 / CDC 4225-83 / SGSC4696) TaxID=290338 RepID=A8AHG0_CITK8|nr:hypothetical protein CKO_01795 [Citrobacter koseri ATCC BAA-895]
MRLIRPTNYAKLVGRIRRDSIAIRQWQFSARSRRSGRTHNGFVDR